IRPSEPPPKSRVLPYTTLFRSVYQLAADMGGAGYIFTGEHDAAVMHNSATINLNILELGCRAGVRRFFYSSSACIYPEYNQLDPDRKSTRLNSSHDQISYAVFC